MLNELSGKCEELQGSYKQLAVDYTSMKKAIETFIRARRKGRIHFCIEEHRRSI